MFLAYALHPNESIFGLQILLCRLVIYAQNPKQHNINLKGVGFLHKNESNYNISISTLVILQSSKYDYKANQAFHFLGNRHTYIAKQSLNKIPHEIFFGFKKPLWCLMGNVENCYNSPNFWIPHKFKAIRSQNKGGRNYAIHCNSLQF